MIRGNRGAYARFLDSIGRGRDNLSVDLCQEGVFRNVGWIGWIGWAKELIESEIKSKSGGGVWCGVYLCVGCVSVCRKAGTTTSPTTGVSSGCSAGISLGISCGSW
jgi:hypothetical protein